MQKRLIKAIKRRNQTGWLNNMVSNKYIGKKVLLTCNNYFCAPDGIDYRYVHGTFNGIIEAKTLLGFKPRRQDVEWYISIGDMLIGGCQVNYAALCDIAPPSDVKGDLLWKITDNGVSSGKRPGKKIYVTH